MTRRTRYHIASNPPPNLPGLVNELAKHFKKEGGVVANRSALKALFDRAHPDYKRAGVADEAMRCLLNCHILAEYKGKTYMNKKLGKAIAKAVASGKPLPDFTPPADMGAYVRYLRQSFRRVRRKQDLPASVRPSPATTPNQIEQPELPAPAEENNDMEILTSEQLAALSTADLRERLQAMEDLQLKLEKCIEQANAIVDERDRRAQELEEQLEALDEQRAKLEEQLEALK